MILSSSEITWQKRLRTQKKLSFLCGILSKRNPENATIEKTAELLTDLMKSGAESEEKR